MPASGCPVPGRNRSGRPARKSGARSGTSRQVAMSDIRTGKPPDCPGHMSPQARFMSMPAGYGRHEQLTAPGKATPYGQQVTGSTFLAASPAMTCPQADKADAASGSAPGRQIRAKQPRNGKTTGTGTGAAGKTGHAAQSQQQQSVRTSMPVPLKQVIPGRNVGPPAPEPEMTADSGPSEPAQSSSTNSWSRNCRSWSRRRAASSKRRSRAASSICFSVSLIRRASCLGSCSLPALGAGAPVSSW